MSMTRDRSFGSLFSGIGGLDLGLERAGWKCTWQVEIDPYCQSVLEHHWPNVPRYGDVKDVDPDDLAPVALIVGGFPCQPVSKAGSGAAQADKRWLWPWFASTIRHLRPRFVLVENVPGLLWANQGRAAAETFGDLAELGYDTEWACLPASALGAPHIRSRLFILGASSEIPNTISEQLRVFGEWELGSSEGQQGESCSTLPGNDGEARAADRGGWWATEPTVGRLVDGLSPELARRQLTALGNAVVPQIAEWIGRRLMDALLLCTGLDDI